MPSKTLQLTFKNVQGRNVTVSVQQPKEPIDPTQVEHVMQNIIEKNIFESSGGDLVEIVGARLVQRQVTTVI